MTADQQRIQARVDARRRADELAGLYVDEAGQLRQQYGLEASTLFLERLRDGLLKIRPLEPQTAPDAAPPPAKGSGARNQRPRGKGPVRAQLQHVVQRRTDKAVGLSRRDDNSRTLLWLPLSQCPELDAVTEGDDVDELTMPEWLAYDKDLDYDREEDEDA